MYPPNRSAIDEKKLCPSQVHAQDEKAEPYKPIAAKKLALTALEEELEKKTLEYEKCWKEGYDLDTDILYNTWKRLERSAVVYH